MAKETAIVRKSAAKAPSLSDYKARLEKLDRELVRLLNERAGMSADMQKQHPDVSAAPGGWHLDDDALNKAIAGSKGPLAERTLRGIFRELFSGARAIQAASRVAYLGPAYTYSHLATQHRFGEAIDPVPVASISAVFEEVNRAHAQFGVVPIENSTDGRIADTLDMFTRLRVRICGEVQLRIHHSLLGKIAREDVTEVYSRPQALSQCRNWLSKHMPAARLIEVTSTATAAQLAQDKAGAAAIASVQAGIHYGLNVLAENIEDNTANVTRFAVIGQQSAPRTGRDKTAIMFEVPNKPGSLADAMAIFKRNKLNMSWIESFPIPRSEGRYLFFVEIDGHEGDLKVRRAMATLEKKAVKLEILGSYPKTEPVG